MSLPQILIAILCVIAISAGQLLFKRASIAINEVGSWMSFKAWVLVAIALAIYGAATLLWIGLLRQVELNRAYLFMALSFVIVPCTSSLIYGESISMGYLSGTALVIIGLYIAINFG